MKIIAIGDVTYSSGGTKHNFNVLKELAKRHEILFYTPAFSISPEGVQKLRELEKNGVKVLDAVNKIIEDKVSRSESRSRLFSKILFQNSLKNYYLDVNLKYVKGLEDLLKDVDIIYDMGEQLEWLTVAYYLGKKLRKPVVSILHDPPFYTISRSLNIYKAWLSEGFTTFTKRSLQYLILRAKMKPAIYKAVNDGVLKGIGAVSLAPLWYSELEKLKDKLLINVFKIANAYDRELLDHRRIKSKEDFCMFYARLVPVKGVLELPKIAENVECEIYIAGKFYSERVKEKVLSSKNKIKYLGFLPYEQLIDYASRAKVVIYPSHLDGFSLVVLESLALGTSVVAYDIPAIMYVYGGLRPVKIVKEYDVKAMARRVNEVLRMKDEDYEAEHNDAKVREFLELHSSWSNVAKEIEDFMLKVVK
ncbi:MAG: glycosyltransferase family 4 protein [Sulfolobaceae archaeon]|nr:glycosyltransferase family 4 protein [Sulfolobaceae archaeon]